jgi:transcriptional regulator with XRE-family HTH domain
MTKKKTKAPTKPTSREKWRALFLRGAAPGSTTATRSDADVGREAGVSRQAAARWRTLLELGPFEPTPVIEQPPAGAPLSAVIGWRIRLHRARLGWTLEQLAETLGGSWNPSAASNAEKGRKGAGRRAVTIDGLADFADALAVSPADLLLLPGQTAIEPALDFQGGPAEAAEAAWVEMMAGAPEIRAVIGINVARRRCLRGWSQTDLAVRVGWSQSRVSNVERGASGQGASGITIPALVTFAEALEVTPADLARLPRQPPLVPVKSG